MSIAAYCISTGLISIKRLARALLTQNKPVHFATSKPSSLRNVETEVARDREAPTKRGKTVSGTPSPPSPYDVHRRGLDPATDAINATSALWAVEPVFSFRLHLLTTSQGPRQPTQAGTSRHSQTPTNIGHLPECDLLEDHAAQGSAGIGQRGRQNLTS